jgi:hypothetical protein
MPSEHEEIEIVCPKYPDHGKVTKRLLPRSEREHITSAAVADVFEIDCPKCGKFEISELPDNNS